MVRFFKNILRKLFGIPSDEIFTGMLNEIKSIRQDMEKKQKSQPAEAPEELKVPEFAPYILYVDHRGDFIYLQKDGTKGRIRGTIDMAAAQRKGLLDKSFSPMDKDKELGHIIFKVKFLPSDGDETIMQEK